MARRLPKPEVRKGAEEPQDGSTQPRKPVDDPDGDSRAPLEVFLANAIDMILGAFVAKLRGDAEKQISPSVSDVVRLMQFRRELKNDEPISEIRVTWIDPYNPEPAS